jgi:hypothetical protein
MMLRRQPTAPRESGVHGAHIGIQFPDENDRRRTVHVWPKLAENIDALQANSDRNPH